jgi:diacylglycerol kinase (ATP)
VDLLRLTHSKGEIYAFNLISVGFTADVATLTNRYFKPLGALGYLFGVLVRVAQLRRRPFTLRCDANANWDDRRCLFLTFNNSKYTGGTMLIAPNANPADALIEFVRWGPIGRLGLLRMLPKLYDGTHIQHPLAERQAIRRAEFNLPAPVDVMIDGEIATLQIQALDIIPGAVDVFI